MANDSAANRSFTDAVSELNKLFDEDELETLIEKARELLQDYAMPRYHRMRTLLLLGSVVGSWDEASACREEAELMWHITRRWHPAGGSADVDTALDELRGSLDELKQALADEEQEEYEDDIDEEIVLLDEAVEEEEAFVIVEYGDTKDQLTADEHALGKTVDELRKLDISKSHVKPLEPPLLREPPIVGEGSERMKIDQEPALESRTLYPHTVRLGEGGHTTDKPIPPLPLEKPHREAAHPSPSPASQRLKRNTSTNTMRSTYSLGTIASTARASSSTKHDTPEKGGQSLRKNPGGTVKKPLWRP